MIQNLQTIYELMPPDHCTPSMMRYDTLPQLSYMTVFLSGEV